MSESRLEKLQRKRDQAWELAGMARKDNDHEDEVKWSRIAKDYQEQIAAYRGVE